MLSPSQEVARGVEKVGVAVHVPGAALREMGEGQLITGAVRQMTVMEGVPKPRKKLYVTDFPGSIKPRLAAIPMLVSVVSLLFEPSMT